MGARGNTLAPGSFGPGTNKNFEPPFSLIKFGNSSEKEEREERMKKKEKKKEEQTRRRKKKNE
jgi:hypothetical protein